jgi:hypothetical protein
MTPTEVPRFHVRGQIAGFLFGGTFGRLRMAASQRNPNRLDRLTIYDELLAFEKVGYGIRQAIAVASTFVHKFSNGAPVDDAEQILGSSRPVPFKMVDGTQGTREP